MCVLGWYGHHNTGDELILQGLRELFKDWKITVLSTEDHGRHSDYTVFDFETANDCDLFVLGGGELIQRNAVFMNSPSVPRKLQKFFYSSWVKKIHVPKVILGCGVNVNTAEELQSNVVKDLAKFDYIGVRDNVALSILNHFSKLYGKTDLFYDLAFSIDTTNKPVVQQKDGSALVVPTDRIMRTDYGIMKQVIFEDSVIWLKNRLKEFDKTKFVAFGFQDNNDVEICKKIRSFLNSEDSPIFNAFSMNLTELLKLFGESSSVFAYRLHGLILAYLVNTPYKFYPYHRKVRRVHETLGLTHDKIKKHQKDVVQQIAGD